jgi:hypothetical protein
MYNEFGERRVQHFHKIEFGRMASRPILMKRILSNFDFTKRIFQITRKVVIVGVSVVVCWELEFISQTKTNKNGKHFRGKKNS